MIAIKAQFLTFSISIRAHCMTHPNDGANKSVALAETQTADPAGSHVDRLRDFVSLDPLRSSDAARSQGYIPGRTAARAIPHSHLLR